MTMKTFTITDRAARGITMTSGHTMFLLGVEVGQGVGKDVAERTGGRLGVRVAIDELDLASRESESRLVREANARDRRALVAVETVAGEGGSTALYSNLIQETLDQKRRRVIRTARPLADAAGITVIAEAITDTGPNWLLALEPGASFRIVRSGDLGDAPPELVVLWNGRWDERRVLEGRDTIKDWGISVFERRLRHGEV